MALGPRLHRLVALFRSDRSPSLSLLTLTRAPALPLFAQKLDRMSAQEPKCCVCGTATTKRCQPCSTNGISLFFCSPEHQKLVWKHHKQVCGSNAHPLLYPFLAQTEVDEIIAHAHILLDKSTPLHGAINTLLRGEDFATYVHSLRSTRSDLPPIDQQHVMFTLRGALQMAKELLNARMELPWLQQSFWTHVARFDTIVLQHIQRGEGMAMEQVPDSLGWSACRHYGVAFLSLVTRRAEQGQSSVPDDLLYKSCDQYLDAIASQRSINPVDVNRLLADLEAELRVVFGVKFAVMSGDLFGRGDMRCCSPTRPRRPYLASTSSVPPSLHRSADSPSACDRSLAVMSPQKTSSCCVCGSRTAKRCEPCSREGVDLFFCSPEHQKLVWKHYKQVCGPKAHPIQYPALSEAEVQDVLSHPQVPLTADGFTLRQFLELEWLHGHPFESFVSSLKGVPPCLTVDQQQSVLGMLRSNLQLAKEARNGGWELPWSRQSFWTHVSRFDTIITSHRARADGLRPPCKLDDGSLKWSTVRHHSIIFLSLMSTRAEAGADLVPDELLYRSCDSYLDAVTDYRALRDDDDAKKLIADLSAEVRVVLKMKFIAMDFFSGTSTEKRSFIRCFPASQ
ncbi:hypothetical protein NBRC10512_001306 [Rhodotorula toruloides]|uniref:RHTO0S16e01442g1_1 n=2 Tax=Rhodotorula toruloides TaxID=5286 RepID=A0A061BDS0_RHOTO|nr:zinc finger, MYND-type domain containing protein [Rhodotorula toruloides NP11]EMS20934.1 zinc finger, MYND-type domain containing protein [Rhodotorula toruloides NP11]CDR48109.1 RHTO0S16e01442g1_1 [Rhodotorula toruloides]